MTLAEKLGEAVRIPTISYSDPSRIDRGELRNFQAFLERVFPGAHSFLRREILSDFAILYTWEGKRKDLDPLLFTAHYDVVPPGEETTWNFSPFGGDPAEGFVRGRGTLDDKQCLVSLLQAAEDLDAQGFVPERSVLFAFGGDEEIGGNEGAARIARLLEEREIRTLFTLDEGAAVVEGVLPGVTVPAALVGIAEKGFLNVEILLQGEAGHSAMPPLRTAAGRIARAAARIEERPFPPRLTPGVGGFLRSLAPHASGPYRLLFAHPRLAAPLLKKVFLGNPATAALVRTTQAVTMLEGSPKENVLPDRARAVINLRLLPGDTSAGVLRRYRNIVQDPEVEIRPLSGRDPSEAVEESSTRGPAWDVLTSTIREVFPGAVPAPYLVTAFTDSRHYRKLSRNIYRFIPMLLSREDVPRIHGKDERISLGNLEACREFYSRLIRKAASPSGAAGE